MMWASDQGGYGEKNPRQGFEVAAAGEIQALSKLNRNTTKFSFINYIKKPPVSLVNYHASTTNLLSYVTHGNISMRTTHPVMTSLTTYRA